MSNTQQDKPYRLVGRVLRPHGVRGEFVVFLESDFPEWLAKRKQFFIKSQDAMIPWPVEKARYDGKRLTVKVTPLADRTAVEAHRDTELFLPEAEASEVAQDPDYFFNSELVGCDVYDVVLEKHLGKVTTVLEMPAQNLLEVTRPQGKPLLIPFVEAMLADIRPGMIEVRLPEGFEAVFDDEGRPNREKP